MCNGCWVAFIVENQTDERFQLRFNDTTLEWGSIAYYHRDKKDQDPWVPDPRLDLDHGKYDTWSPYLCQDVWAGGSAQICFAGKGLSGAQGEIYLDSAHGTIFKIKFNIDHHTFGTSDGSFNIEDVQSGFDVTSERNGGKDPLGEQIIRVKRK